MRKLAMLLAWVLALGMAACAEEIAAEPIEPAIEAPEQPLWTGDMAEWDGEEALGREVAAPEAEAEIEPKGRSTHKYSTWTEGDMEYDTYMDPEIGVWGARVVRYLGLTNTVVIPKTSNGYDVLYIGDLAFSDKNIVRVTLPEKLLKIGDNAFSHNHLISLILPDSLVEIGRGAFLMNAGLENVKFGSGLARIGQSAFNECSELKAIAIPNGVESIGPYAFSNCSRLSEVQLGASVKTIDRYAFGECYALKSVALPDSVQTIGDNAFISCLRLSKVDFGKGLKTIGQCAFYESRLTEVSLPDSLESIGDSAFFLCERLEKVELGQGVQTIGKFAFSQCAKLKTVELPDSVSTVGQGAFLYDSSLVDLKLGKNLSVIGDSAFGMTAVKSVVIPNSVAAIGEGAFNYSGLESVVLGTSLHVIPDNAFKVCERLKQVVIPDGVKGVGNNAFSGCDALESVVIGKGVQSLGEYAFSSCDALKAIAIPGNVKVIGELAFFDCGKLENAVLEEGVEALRYGAFEHCRSLRTIAIPASVTDIDDKAFIVNINDQWVENPNLTIRCPAGAYAEQWAATHGYSTERLGEPTDPTTPADINQCDIDIDSQTYTGKAVKPVPVVADGGVPLTYKTDFKLSYKANKKVGTATVTVKGIGKYTGTKQVAFDILPKGTKLSKLAAGKKQLSVKWNKQAKSASGYEIQYATKKDFSDAKAVTVKKISATSTTIKKLKSGKKYYVRVRTWAKAGGKTYYSEWSKAKSAKVK